MARIRISRLAVAIAMAPVACGCSDRSHDPRLGRSPGQIVGGYVDSVTRGAVGIGYDIAGTYYGAGCSGTLISPNVVLTATHCVTYTDTGDAGVDCSTAMFGGPMYAPYVLVSPETTFPANTGLPGLYRAREIRSAPGPGLLCGYDVSLVLLQGAGIPASAAMPIEPRLDDMPAAYEPFDAIGYGLTSATDTTGQTAGTRMRIDNRSAICRGSGCDAIAPNYAANDEWIGDTPACPGDSGGPALDALGRVEGVASRGGDGCSYLLYAGLPAWKSFIIDTVVEAARLGAIVPPTWTGVVLPEAGTQDSGAQESGAPEAAAPDAAKDAPVTSPDAGSVVPDAQTETSDGPPQLGESCTTTCAADLACVSESGKPPGTCVPHCGFGKPPCPSPLACSSLGVCVHNAAAAPSDGGCAIVSGSRASGLFSASMLLFAAGLRRFRRRS